MCSRKSFESPVTLTLVGADLQRVETPLPPVAVDGETRVEGAVAFVQTDVLAAAVAAAEATELTIDAEEVEAIAADDEVDLTHVKVPADCSES